MEIQLKDKVVIIDDSDYFLISKYSWYIVENNNGNYYAKANVNGEEIYMHRFILEINDEFIVDHKDNNGLNNKRENLRICNHSQNIRNQVRKRRSNSGYKGVSRIKDRGYVASLRYNKKYVYLGYYMSPKDAAIAYNEAALKYFGEFANLNKIEN